MTDQDEPNLNEFNADHAAATPRPVKRRAVLVIHGIGEQRPMETLRGFVDAVLGEKPASPSGSARPRFYSKPDSLAEGFELRRLVAADNKRRTDFYELYWAHLMPIAATDRLTAWFWMLLARWPGDVPPRFRPIWWISWIGVALAVLLALASIFAFATTGIAEGSIAPKLPWGLAIVLAALSITIRAYAGDAAVYLSPHPRTVESRNRIRSAALSLLDKLHASGRYERIVVIGHSLGSVIGYDMLTYAWQRASDRQREAVAGRAPGKPLPAGEAFQHAESVARNMVKTDAGKPRPGIEQWEQATAALQEEQQAEGLNWLVTDFVTLGSPLAHGDLLLARNRPDFDRRVAESELPIAPPLLEFGRYFSFAVYPKAGGVEPNGRVLHHAACFALTRWTNLYFPCRWLVWGDAVGGAAQPLFGPGVRDVPVATRRWNGLLAHTHYWTMDKRDEGKPGDPVAALRSTLAWP
ncbi:MAG: hypothetical protein K2Z25_11230 [Beijerinckiaceae bacterium]|nr:hypothetical protein [Beijerinckiaceae bacterium]